MRLKDCLNFSTFATVAVFSIIPNHGFSQGLVSQLKSIQPIEIAYPDHGLEVGAGWDALLGRKTGSTCVEFMEINVPKTAFSHHNRVIRNTYELTNTGFANLIASGGWGSVNGSIDRNEKISRDAVNILSQYTFEVGSVQLANIRSLTEKENNKLTDDELSTVNRGNLITLTTDAKKILEDESLNDKEKKAKFRQACGTGYVANIKRGARISILATRHVADRSTKERIEASARASGWGTSFSGKFIDSTHKTKKTEQASIKIHQEGGAKLVQINKDFNPEKLALNNLDLENIKNNPSSFSATIFPYTSVADVPFKLALNPFPMEDYSKLYFFFNDLLGMYDDVSKDIYSTRYEASTPTEDFSYSKISVAATGGEKKVLVNRDNLRRTIQALIDALENCYYSAADLSKNECDREQSLNDTKAKFMLPPSTALQGSALQNNTGEKDLELVAKSSANSNHPSPNPTFQKSAGLDFLFFLDESKGASTTISEKSEKSNPPTKGSAALSNNSTATVSTKGKNLRGLKTLANQLFKYAMALPLRNSDLNLNLAAKQLGIPVHQLWGEDKNKKALKEYIRDKIFYIRLHSMREELCSLRSGIELCFSDADLAALLNDLDLEFDSSLFPAAPLEKDIKTTPEPKSSGGVAGGCIGMGCIHQH